MQKSKNKQTDIRRYNGNNKLKAANVKINFTPEQLREYIKCKNDAVYFAERYVKIVTLDHGFIDIPLYDFQKRMIADFQDHRFNIAKIGRQSGKSTVCWIYLLWAVIFNDDYSAAIISKTEKSAKIILARLKKAYESLPLWLQQGVSAWNIKSIELDNGSRVEVMTGARGDSLNLILLDEMAFIKKHNADELMEDLIPALSAGSNTKLIIISTPNGQNHFYHEWMRAVNGESGYNWIEVNWDEVPGRDQVWADNLRAKIGNEKFEQEVLCSFKGSAGTLIPGVVLRQLHHTEPEIEANNLKIWEQPRHDRKYFMTCDVSHGKGIDYSVFHVFDVTEYPFKQVARYRNNYLAPQELPHLLLQVGSKYNSCPIVIESNEIGGQVAYILHYDLEYPEVYRKSGSNGRFEYGLRQTKATKSLGCAVLRELLENHKLILNDKETLDELTVFVRHGDDANVRYAAETGMHDDCVMGLVIFSYMTTQKYFKEEFEKDLFRKMGDEYQKSLEEDLPMGFYDDGIGGGDDDGFIIF